MEIKKEDLQLVSNLGQSLWAQPEQASSISRDTVSAVTALDADPGRAIERAAQVLLDRANQKGMYARVPNGFNALFPEERLILLALHQGRWSYERIARVVRESVEMVQQLAWNARVYLALSHYPAAPTLASPSCPEYDPQRPWTQRFLDEELSGQEKTFLQSHLSGCTECRDALVRAKELYYRVQKQLELLETHLPNPGLTAQLHSLVEQGQRIKYPGRVSGTDAILGFLERTDVRVALLIWVAGLIYFLKH